MRELIRPLLLMGILLAVPIIPFVLFGAALEARIESWSQTRRSAPAAALLVVGLLSTDVFLPIPSSLISTLGGWQLGAWGGTIASWVGMSLGASLGFWLARRWGRPLALRLARAESLERMEVLSRRYGVEMLVFARGVPVFAEASVLLMGIHRLPWHRFLPPILLSNLGIALAYSVFGDVAYEHEWLPLALAVSIALPILLATMVGRWLRTRDDEQGDRT